MRLGKFALFALGAAVTLGSAVTALTFDHFGIVGPIVESGRAHASTDITPPVPRPAVMPARADRFAYVPLDIVLQLPTAPDDLLPLPEELLAPKPAEREVASLWSTETRPDKTIHSEGPRISAWAPQSRPRQIPMPRTAFRDATLAKRLTQISPGATKRLVEKFNVAKAVWPPADIAFVAVKDEKILELHARSEGGAWKFIHRYPVLAASGGAGPKLRQGDKQVPEGVYRISYLNPSSRYHVSLRVNYPNTFDRQMANQDGRHDLGGDIMIHGKALSVGCLAVGDEAAEELFVLAAETGLPNIKVVIAPTDFRRRAAPTTEANQPKWLPKLYAEVATAMTEFKAPPRNNMLSSFFGN